MSLRTSLTNIQEQQFAALDALYHEWNEKINLISRKDIDNLMEHHVLHSLAIGEYISFAAGTTILDVGTGGGFPGIPLAILFPECRFTLIDSIGKKVMVAADIAKRIGLTNVECLHERVEEEKRQFDFVVSRAVMPLPDLVKLVRKNVHHKYKNAIPNGVIVLKGGNLDAEIAPFRKSAEVTEISSFAASSIAPAQTTMASANNKSTATSITPLSFSGDWFTEKRIIYLPL